MSWHNRVNFNRYFFRKKVKHFKKIKSYQHIFCKKKTINYFKLIHFLTFNNIIYYGLHEKCIINVNVLFSFYLSMMLDYLL